MRTIFCAKQHLLTFKKLFTMKKVIFPAALIAGVVGLLSVHAVPVTPLLAPAAGLISADTVAPDTTKKLSLALLAPAAGLVSADTVAPDTTKKLSVMSLI
jgi:hypothetical protein